MELLNSDPLLLTQKIIAIAVLLQGFEMLSLHKTYCDDGVWQWKTIAPEFLLSPKIIQSLLAIFLSYPNFIFLILLQCGAAIFLLCGDTSVNWAFLLLICTLLICIRWRGTFNGGSDYMAVVVLSALSVAAAFKDNEMVLFGAVCYIALHSTLSYFLAGVCKIKNRSWRNGFALSSFLQASSLELPKFLQKFAKSKRLMVLSSWGVMLFECSFPLAFLGPNFALFYMAIAFTFHLANFYVLGLNRFVFTWVATYPALLFCSSIV